MSQRGKREMHGAKLRGRARAKSPLMMKTRRPVESRHAWKKLILVHEGLAVGLVGAAS